MNKPCLIAITLIAYVVFLTGCDDDSDNAIVYSHSTVLVNNQTDQIAAISYPDGTGSKVELIKPGASKGFYTTYYLMGDVIVECAGKKLATPVMYVSYCRCYLSHDGYKIAVSENG